MRRAKRGAALRSPTDPELAELVARLLELAGRDQVPQVFTPGPLVDDWARLVGVLLSAWSVINTRCPEVCAETVTALRLLALSAGEERSD